MSDGKRRDKKGRILLTGEYQDAAGRYSYKYTNSMGQRKAVYSWRLTEADVTPPGRKDSKPLREKEKEIQRLLPRGVYAEDMSVCDLVERYLATKTGVRHNTEANYRFVQNILRKEAFDVMKISRVKLSDAKLFLIKLQSDGKGYSTIHSVRGVLRPAFQMAVDDEMILRNPFEFQLATVVVNDSVTRQALSRADQKKFLEFIREDSYYSRYYDAMFILLHTGMRISEFCGLTLKDIDFENNTINIDHQLQRMRKMEYVIEPTKTTCGTRRLPMSDEVADAFWRIIQKHRKPKKEPMIGGYAGFLFLDQNGNSMVAQHWEKHFQLAVKKHNKIYRVQLPTISPHVCRHTYCSNMAKSGMNPKTLQYLMGHSDIGVTLNTYTHLGEQDAKEEMVKLGLVSSEPALKRKM